MRITANMAIFALVAMPCHPEEQQDSKQQVTVYVDSRADVPMETLTRAEVLASEMFKKAAVSLKWRSSLSKLYDIEQTITLGITSNTPRTFHPGALAYAEAYAGPSKGIHIRVFFDRVENVAGSSKLVPTLLAHVLVHEITHILQNSDHHSEEGVMKKRYTAADLYQMSLKPLPFSPSDIELIRRGISNQGRAAASTRLGKGPVAEAVAAQ
jgi:hypothetical protein